MVKKKKRIPDDISVIPNSSGKFMSFKIGELKFIDSAQFMASSIEQLTENLYDENDKYKHFHCMKSHFPEHMGLLCRKGLYPYEWFDNNDKFNHVGLPTIDDFDNELKQEGISYIKLPPEEKSKDLEEVTHIINKLKSRISRNKLRNKYDGEVNELLKKYEKLRSVKEDYKHANNVYDSLKCKTFLDYHLTYLKCDVLLLADIFENFRKTCKINYDLDPANYISSPSLAWDAMLLNTGIELKLISDPKIFNIIERQKRGGLCFVGSKRYVKANNRYLKDFDANLQENYLLYLDANNLYGWAMTQSLPYKNIKLDEKVTLEEILNTADDSSTGYIVEVDLSFPEEIHEKLKQYVPCPENIAPKYEWLSGLQKKNSRSSN